MGDETRWLSEEEFRAWHNHVLMQMQLQAALARSLQADGLSYQDYAVLAELTNTDAGRLRVVELGRQIGWEKSRISHHCSRMERRGLVRRERVESDQRGAFVTVTDAGRAAIAAAAPRHVAAVREYFVDLLTPEQLQLCGDISEKVMNRLQQSLEESDL